MFKDYYDILGIHQKATPTEIQNAYRRQAKRWHPDRNPGVDVKERMQDINEAYAILKEHEKRLRYDMEYAKYQRYQKERAFHTRKTTNSQQKENTSTYSNRSDAKENKNWEENRYEVNDEKLREDIDNARKYAKEIVEEFYSVMKNNTKLALEGAWEGAKWYVYIFIAFFILGILLRNS